MGQLGTYPAPAALTGTEAVDILQTGHVRSVPLSTLAALADWPRNLLHNARFRFNQRGAGSITANSGFPVDRWYHGDATNGSRTVARTALSDADRTAIGDEDARYGVNIQTTGSAGSADYEILQHHVEDVWTLAGKTATLSFWAKAAVAGQQVTAELAQNFGTGGSSQVTGIGTTKFTLTTTWTRYAVTFAVPSTAGKTVGSSGDNLELTFWTSAGSAWNARSASLGQQTSNVTIWGPQLEVGAAISPLEKVPYALALSLSQRFYQTLLASVRGPAAGAGAIFECTVSWPPMRAIPVAASLGAGSQNNVSGSPTLIPLSQSMARFTISAAGAGDTFALGNPWSLTADL